MNRTMGVICARRFAPERFLACSSYQLHLIFFFFQAEDGIRDVAVTGVQTCALPICSRPLLLEIQALVAPTDLAMPRRVATGVDPKRLAMIVAVLSRHAGVALGQADEIGRASCRERV